MAAPPQISACQSAFTPELVVSLQSDPAADQTATESPLEDQSVQVRFLLPVCGNGLVTMVPQWCTRGLSLIDESQTQSQLRRVGLPSCSALSAGSLGPSVRKSGLRHSNRNNACMQVSSFIRTSEAVKSAKRSVSHRR